MQVSVAQRRTAKACAQTPSKVRFGGIQHAGMIVENTNKALRFYLDVLGMEDDTATRPQLAFKGAFVRAGAQQIHLMELPNPDPKMGRPDHGGRDKHVAFTVCLS